MHHLGLRYPAELLIEALLMRLNGTPALKSARNAISKGLNKTDSLVREAAEEFRQNVSRTPPLRDGVLSGLEKLRKDEAIIIVATEGGLKRIRKHLFHHCLSEFIDLSIETTKTPNFFSRCRKLHQERTPWCIGAQITRDINPAVEAGFRGLYFPGGFSPTWESNRPFFQNFITVDNYFDGVNYALNSRK
jgi:putative hydrolase of the HAD superfamily